MLRKILKVFFASKFIFITPKNCVLIVFDDVAINELKLILKIEIIFYLKIDMKILKRFISLFILS